MMHTNTVTQFSVQIISVSTTSFHVYWAYLFVWLSQQKVINKKTSIMQN